MNKIKGYIRLTRPANIVTAVSDILAGLAIATYLIQLVADISNVPFDLSEKDIHRSIFLLILSTIGLYGGGVVLNDVFDAELDKVERPERPIPSGLISKRSAAILGYGLLILGVAAAAITNIHNVFSVSGFLALAIAVAAIVYDKWGKHHSFLGPLNMGLCRGLNLLLGMSVFPASLEHFWLLGLVPVVYVAAITMISRGEVHGGKRITLYSAAALYNIVIATILVVSYLNDTLLQSIGFVILFAALIFPSLQKAILEPQGPQIGRAVKSGVIALIAMNASWAAAFSNLYLAFFILLLLPLSLILARLFAVT